MYKGPDKAASLDLLVLVFFAVHGRRVPGELDHASNDAMYADFLDFAFSIESQFTKKIFRFIEDFSRNF